MAQPAAELNASAQARAVARRRALPIVSTAAGMRIAFGIVLAIDAVLKWLPGFRSTYVSQLKHAAHGQPAFLHGWFHFWISLSEKVPNVFVDLAAVTETALAAVLLLGIARRVGYLGGAAYMLMVWAVGEGFGRPYSSGATDIGTGIIYTLVFLTLYFHAPPARDDRPSLDRRLVGRFRWWRFLAETHADERR